MAEERGVIKYKANDGSDIKLTFDTIRRYLVSGHPEYVSDQELMYFGGICKARGLNPFAKDAYLIKYTQNDPAAIITSIDYFRARAKSQTDCQGWKAGIIVKTASGDIRRSNGLILEGETLVGGWFSAQPRGWHEPFELEVNLKPYIKMTKDGYPTKFWSEENQPTMIRKVAESQGLREVWPAEFAKLYVPEEVDSGLVMETSFSVPVAPEGESSGSPANTGPDVRVRAFDNATQDLPQDALATYLDLCASHFGKGLDGFKVKVMKQNEIDGFKKAFMTWYGTQAKKVQAPSQQEEMPEVQKPDVVATTTPKAMNQDQFLATVSEIIASVPKGKGKAEALQLMKEMKIGKLEDVGQESFQSFIDELVMRVKER